MPLSDETKEALRLHGITAEERGMRVCARCGEHQSNVPASKRHPLDEDIRKTKKQLRQYRGHPVLQAHLHKLESIRNHTSRCCGARFDYRVYNRQETYWEQWLQRRERCPWTIEQMRQEYGHQESKRDDDFIMLSHMWAISDGLVGELVRIFRREEEIQRAALAAEQLERAVTSDCPVAG